MQICGWVTSFVYHKHFFRKSLTECAVNVVKTTQDMGKKKVIHVTLLIQTKRFIWFYTLLFPWKQMGKKISLLIHANFYLDVHSCKTLLPLTTFCLSSHMTAVWSCDILLREK